RLHLSGILTMVVFAMAVARRTGGVIPARIRIPSYAVWEFAVFVLNVLAFILVGFQLKGILRRIDTTTLLTYSGIAVAVCGATIIARVAYIAGAAALDRWWCRERGKSAARPRAPRLSKRAAAVALPTGGADGQAFPYRDLVVFISFSVVLGTLVVQGMTLRPLMGWL